MEIKEAPVTSKGNLYRCADPRGLWHPVVSLLASWAPPRVWPNVSGTPDTMEKALQEVGETLWHPSTHVAMGAVGWVFISAL